MGTLVAPATAAPTEGILLKGSRTAWVDLYVYVNETVAVADVRMSTQGTFVGFFLSPAPADRDSVGALVMPRVGATGGDTASVVKLGESWDVRAGRYRAFLITDGPAEVFIPIEGQGNRGWTPRAKAPLSVRPADFDIPPGEASASLTVPVNPKVRSLVVAAAMASSSSLTAVDQLTACVRVSSDCTPTQAVSARLPLSRTWSSGVHFAKPGSYTAELEISRTGGADAGSRVDGVVLVLTVGRQT